MQLQQSFLMAYILFFSVLAGFLIVQTARADKVHLNVNIKLQKETRDRLDKCKIDVNEPANIKNAPGKRLGFGRRRRASAPSTANGLSLPLPAQVWLTDKVVPFKISKLFTSDQRSTILRAINEFHDKTCIRFKELTDQTETKYVDITPIKLLEDFCSGCGCELWGPGRGQSKQMDILAIQPDCVEFGNVLHRLMHAVGYDDEQTRHDRDTYIEIVDSNIRESRKPRFDKYSTQYEHSATGYPYDYGSIMHQGPYWLSENPNSPTGKTIIQLGNRPGSDKMGQRTGFSEQDLIRINDQWCDAPGLKTNNPLLIAGKFEGDINGISDDDFEMRDDGKMVLSNAAREKWQKWPKCVVPYTLADDFTDEERQIIDKAFKAFHDNTCIQFKKRKDEKNFLHLNSHGTGCESDWGLRDYGQQFVNISRRSDCIEPGIVMHELMHALGFVHEQSRDDRDNYVEILWDNIDPEKCGNYMQFLRYSDKDIDHLGADYDYDSVLHYNITDFTKSDEDDPRPLKTIRPTKPGGDKIGQRTHLSQTDILKINKLYKDECTCDKKATDTGTTQGEKQTTTKSGGGKQTTPIPQKPGVDQTQRPGGIGFAIGAGSPGGININVQINGNKKPSSKRPRKKTTTISPDEKATTISPDEKATTISPDEKATTKSDEEETTTKPPGGKNSKKCMNMPNFDSICRTLKSNSVKCKKDLARLLCPKTCGNCKFSLGTCKDTANKKTCSPLPKNKKCDKEPGLNKCRKTCGHCLQSINGSVKPGPKCQDKTNLPFKCADLKKKNFCKTLKNVAMETCPKTCNLCKSKN